MELMLNFFYGDFLRRVILILFSLAVMISSFFSNCSMCGTLDRAA